MANRPGDLWLRVEIGQPEECWPWLGGTRPNGYGIISIAGRNRSTHRVAYELANGFPAPSHLFVCHTCDNPPCCNPAHLYLGTPAQNSGDREQRGRRRILKGESQPQAKLTAPQITAIRKRRTAGERGVDLATEFGVTPQTICNVVKGRRYAT